MGLFFVQFCLIWNLVTAKKSLNAKIQQKPAKQTLRKAQDGEGKQRYGSAAGADVNVKVGRSNQTHAVYIPCMYDY